MTNNWQKYIVSDRFLVTNGSTNSDDAVIGGQYPLFDRSVAIKSSNKYLFDTEAIIIPGEGKEFIPRYYKGKFDLHQRAYAIYTKSAENNILIKYLYYWMDFNKDYLSKMAVGSTVKSLRMYMLERFPLIAPSNMAQHKIIKILDNLNLATVKTDQIIQKIDLLKQGLMQELFTKGIGHKKFKKTNLGEIPDDWGIKPLDAVALIVDSLHQTPKYAVDGIPMVRVVDIKAGELDLSNCIKVSEEVYETFTKNHKPKKGDVVISRVGSFGIFAYVNDSRRFCLGQNTAIISPRANSNYLFYALQSPIPSSQVDKQVVGSNQKTLSLKYIRGLFIPIPPDNEQQKIAEVLSFIDKKISLEIMEKEKLITLKNGLMQDIFNQKVQIN